MFSFNSLHPGSLQRFLTQSVFALFFMSAVLFIGCPTEEEEDSNPSLHGRWTASYGDAYIINLNSQTLEYDDGGWGTGFEGDILKIAKFDSKGTAGIIFIEYTAKPVDYDTAIEPAGDYIGIYFRNLTRATGQFAPPIEEYEAGKYKTPAKASLAETEASFNLDNMGNFVSFWVTYEKQ